MKWIVFPSIVTCLFVGCQALSEAEKSVFTNLGKVSFQEATNANNKPTYIISSDGIPIQVTARSSNSVDAEHEFQILRDPTFSNKPTCLSSGPIAMTIDGVALFGPLTSSGYNAVEGDGSEAVGFDTCSGHNTQSKTYHHHMIPNCLYTSGVDQLLGVAFDGFPIYGPKSSCIDSTRNATAADLDECHGIETASCSYRYIITYDFPYIIGCYKGRIVDSNVRSRGNEQCVYTDELVSDADEEAYHLWNGNPGKICSCRPEGGAYAPANEWETPTSTEKRTLKNKKENRKFKSLERLLKKWLKQNS